MVCEMGGSGRTAATASTICSKQHVSILCCSHLDFSQLVLSAPFGLVWFYGTSTIVGYLMPNPFLYIQTFLYQTIQFSISTQFQCQKTVPFQKVRSLYVKTVQFQAI